MSTQKYIRFPVSSNASLMAIDVYNYIKVRAPLWLENDNNLDTWVIQAFSTLAADLMELVNDVPDDIFRWFGASLIALPPIDATQSSVLSTWTMVNNAGYTIPAGTQVAIKDTAGNRIAFETLVDVIVPAGSTATSAGAVQLRSVDTGAVTSGLGGVGVVVELLDTLAFVSTVVLTAATSGGVDAEDDDTYLDRLARYLRLLSTRPILPIDFAVMARNVAGVARAVAIDLYNPVHNLLSANDASIETSAAGWTAVVNCSIARSTAQAADGAASLALTGTAATGGMNAYQALAQMIPVKPGDVITGLGSSRAAVTPRTARVDINWVKADASTSSSITPYAIGTGVSDSTTGWTALSVTGTAPADAAFARLIVEISATVAAGEVHYFDKMSVRRGSGTDWVAGGTGETGQARTVTVAAIDANGNDVSSPVQTTIQNLLTANREVNFLTYVVGAKRSPIDVTFAAKAAAGYVASDVQARAIAAVQAYLSQATWGSTVDDALIWNESTVVRFSEVGQAISNVEGLDYWTSLVMGYTGGPLVAADVTIAGPAALATPGVITGTVT